MKSFPLYFVGSYADGEIQGLIAGPFITEDTADFEIDREHRDRRFAVVCKAELPFAVRKYNSREECWKREEEQSARLKNKAEKQVTGVPHNAICYFMDGDKFCCVFGDFVDLQESPAGFGDTQESAYEQLLLEFNKTKSEQGASHA